MSKILKKVPNTHRRGFLYESVKKTIFKTFPMKCNICRKHDIETRDYRFIESCGLQGKIFVCNWCFGLNDVTVSEIIRNETDPVDFYDFDSCCDKNSASGNGL